MVPGLFVKNLPVFIFGEKVYLAIILIVLYCSLDEVLIKEDVQAFPKKSVFYYR